MNCRPFVDCAEAADIGKRPLSSWFEEPVDGSSGASETTAPRSGVAGGGTAKTRLAVVGWNVVSSGDRRSRKLLAWVT